MIGHHHTDPVVTRITPALVTGSTYRLCDSASTVSVNRIEP